ncbi:727_t:CDS:2 [Cetraspora pellucida]|uniref:727_t:CDS:1 n=1 Tax=Cetraspora pellucida TaxID=1433469 RepID=A0ACA9K633_9GLOM|nr:727_t:CDS:2 [Cetraspora pellucida]
MPDYLERDVLKKHKSRENEISYQCQNHLAYDHDNKMKRRSTESAEECRECLNKEKVSTEIEFLNEFDRNLLQKF